MWRQFQPLLHIYNLLSVLIIPSSSTVPPDTLPWQDIKEIDDGIIDSEKFHHLYVNTVFQPTSFLSPGYGVLFEHIGNLYPTVHRQYIVLGLRLPTYRDIPDWNASFYDKCNQYATSKGNPIHKIMEDACRLDDFHHLHHLAISLIHSDLPAILPNQQVSMLRESELPLSSFDLGMDHSYHITQAAPAAPVSHSSSFDFSNQQDSNFLPPRSKRDINTWPEPLDFSRARDYYMKYHKPLPTDEDTLYTYNVINRSSFPTNSTKFRNKRFLGAIFRGIRSLFKGGNVLGTIVKGVKKIGGFIYKGIRGLIHRHKTTALSTAIRAIKGTTSKLRLGGLFRVRKIRDLHIGKVSLFDKLNKGFHSAIHGIDHRIDRIFQQIHTLRRDMPRPNIYEPFLEFYMLRERRLTELRDFIYWLQHFLNGLDILSTGRLSTTLVHPRRLLHFLTKVVRAAEVRDPDFQPLYPELYHYYETKMVSFTNTEDMLIIQIPVFFVPRAKPPLHLFRIKQVPVPLDKDTYEGREAKYTTLVPSKYDHFAVSGREYIELTSHTLEACVSLHMDYLCETVQLTAEVTTLSCIAAIYMDISLSYLKPDILKPIIRDQCNFTYHERYFPTPTVLQTQDEILLAGVPQEHWRIVCKEQADRPLTIPGAIYTVINKDDLCTCGVLANDVFLYESMRSCETPDTRLTLFYVYNRALTNYDSSISGYDSREYARKPYDYVAPDIKFIRPTTLASDQQMFSTIDQEGNPSPRVKRNVPPGKRFFSLKRPTRVKRTAPDPDSSESDDLLLLFDDEVSMPLDNAIGLMEHNTPFYLPPQYKSYQKPFAHPSPSWMHILNSPQANFYCNFLTILNTITNISFLLSSVHVLRPKGLLFQMVSGIVAFLQSSQRSEALILRPQEVTTASWDIADSPPSDDDPETIPPLPLALWVLVALFVALLTIYFLIFIFCRILIPLTRRSSLLRPLCLGCQKSSDHLEANTDIYLDIIHILSGESIRVFITAIAAPPCALSFTGSVRLHNFTLTQGRFQLMLHIDWHDCVLHYNEFAIPLPPTGTAFFYQQNLLTDFNRPTPYNVQLLARHMDSLIQIPHTSQLDYVSSTDRLSFASSPYANVQTELDHLRDSTSPSAPAILHTHPDVAVVPNSTITSL